MFSAPLTLRHRLNRHRLKKLLQKKLRQQNPKPKLPLKLRLPLKPKLRQLKPKLRQLKPLLRLQQQPKASPAAVPSSAAV